MVQRWRPGLLPAVGLFYVIILGVTIALSVVHLIQENAEKHVVAWFVAGIFVMMTIPISLYDIGNHLVHYSQGDLQRYYIRIIWMVPIYSLDSWLALRFPGYAVYFDTLRECYEAYVIYNFMQMLITFLKKQHERAQYALATVYHRHMFPCCCLSPWMPGQHFVTLCNCGVLQYTLVRVITAVIAFVCAMVGRSQFGKFEWNNAWPYLMITNNISQCWAIYCLVLFYYAAKAQLKPLKPLPKILCVKMVVFFSFWQSVLISLMGEFGAIPHSSRWTTYRTTKAVATSIQDFMICIEMFLAAIAHHYAFSHKPFVEEDVNTLSCCVNCWHSSSVLDVKDDIIAHARYVLGRVQIRSVASDETSRLVELQPIRPQPTNDKMTNQAADQ